MKEKKSLSVKSTHSISSLLIIKRLPLSLICFFIVLMWYLASRCETQEALDLHRYYSGAILLKDAPLSVVVQQSFARSYDFIYYLLLQFALRLSIPLNLLTAIIVTVYYIMIISCMKEEYRGRMEWHALFAVLFLAPITWIIEISRNLTAIVFLYVSIKMYLKRKLRWTFVFSLLALFTHFSILMYIAIFVVCVFLRKIHLRRGLVVLLILGLMVVSYMIPSYLIDLMSVALSGDDSVYGTQYSGLTVRGISEWTSVGYGDLLPVIYSLIFSTGVLFYNRNQGFEFWILLSLTTMLAFFVNSNQMFTNRCIMIMPLFWGLNIARIYNNVSMKEKHKISVLCLLAIPIILLHIWSYRPLYLPFV